MSFCQRYITSAIGRHEHRKLIVRMMSGFENDLVDALKEVVKGSNWQNVGNIENLKRQKCRRLYADDGEDMVLICLDGGKRIYAMDASCPHEGGPLEQGDIEDMDGRMIIICPWHSYDFDLVTGQSSSGLKQDTYKVEIVNGDVYVNTDRVLSLKPIKTVPTSEPVASTDKTDEASTVSQEEDKDSLCYWAVKILETSDPAEKVRLSHEVGEKWRNKEITKTGYTPPPCQPKRDNLLNVVAPGKERKRGKGGSLSSRISNLHSMANIEQWAIDLSWDIIARFSLEKVAGAELPKGFFDDFVQVACEEAKHFNLISQRLQDLDSHFGALPVHNGLWDSAKETSDSLLARLAILHMVHEARGLDVQPKTLEKFSNHGDKESVKILEIIYKEEINHVAAGLRWFTYICNNSDPPMDCISTFHSIVKKYFRGYLKPPFNAEGRSQAGMVEEWYLPLVKPKVSPEKSHDAVT